jgi:hypothetical protein
MRERGKEAGGRNGQTMYAHMNKLIKKKIKKTKQKKAFYFQNHFSLGLYVSQAYSYNDYLFIHSYF